MSKGTIVQKSIKVKTRQSNFELLRIVAMIMIIMFHSVLDSVNRPVGEVFASNTELVGALRFIMDFFGNTGVTLFAMISGYFLITAKESDSPFKRASEAGVKFAGMILYNGIIITGIFAFGLAVINKLGLINLSTVLPANIFVDINSVFAFAGGYWYLSAYFILLIFIQPLNRYLNRLQSAKTFFYFIVVISLGSSIFNYIPIFAVRDGVNFPLVFVGYVLGAFARKFNPLSKMSAAKIWLIILLYPMYFVFSFEFLVRGLHVMARGANPAVGYYVGFPVYVLSFLIFTLFMRLNFTNKTINLIAPATVFVYIFHTATPYGMFYRAANVLYTNWAMSLGLGHVALTLVVPLFVFGYAVIILLVATLLYFVYEGLTRFITGWFVDSIKD